MATYRGTNRDDTLTGSSGADTLNGQGGNDILDGAGGADRLTGGKGADVFLYSGSVAGLSIPAAPDTILDFSRAEGDRISFAGLTLTGTGAPASLTWAGGAPKAWGPLADRRHPARGCEWRCCRGPRHPPPGRPGPGRIGFHRPRATAFHLPCGPLGRLLARL
jgi:hypothetical protein